MLIRRAYHLAARVPGLRQLSEPLRTLYRRLKGKPPVERRGGREIERLLALPDRARYDDLATLNAVAAARHASVALHERLGFDARSAPVLRTVQRVHAGLAAGIDLEQARREGSAPVRFEAAWALHLAGETGDPAAAALETFAALAADETLLARARHSVYARDIVVRSAEIVGRQAERTGDLDTAVRLYDRAVRAGGRGTIPRRLTALLLRQGRIREAGALAERALRSDHDLASQATKDDAHLMRAAALLARSSDA